MREDWKTFLTLMLHSCWHFPHKWARVPRLWGDCVRLTMSPVPSEGEAGPEQWPGVQGHVRQGHNRPLGGHQQLKLRSTANKCSFIRHTSSCRSEDLSTRMLPVPIVEAIDSWCFCHILTSCRDHPKPLSSSKYHPVVPVSPRQQMDWLLVRLRCDERGLNLPLMSHIRGSLKF